MLLVGHARPGLPSGNLMSVGGVWQQHTVLPVIETSDVYQNVVGTALETRRLLAYTPGLY